MPRIVRRRPSKTTPRVKDGRVQRKNYRDVDHGPVGPLKIRVDVPGPGYRHVLTREHVERFLQLIPHWDRVRRGLRQIVLADRSDRADGWYQDGTVAISPWWDPVPVTINAWYHHAHREIWERLGVPARLTTDFVCAKEADPPRDDQEPPRWLSPVIEKTFGITRHDIRPGEGLGEWLVIDQDEAEDGPIIAEISWVDGELHLYERLWFMRFDKHTAAAYQLLHILLHELGHHLDAMATPYPGFVVRGEDYAEQWAIRCAEKIWDDYIAAFR